MSDKILGVLLFGAIIAFVWGSWPHFAKRKRRECAPVQTFERAKLEARLQGMAADDDLWPQMVALLDEYVRTELHVLTQHGLDDAEAHRLRGRVGMVVDLRGELAGLWERTHPQRKPESGE